MSIREDLIERCARKRDQKVGPLSKEAFAELTLAVRENPAGFADEAAEQALLVLADALDSHRAAARDDDLLDDDAFAAERSKRLRRLMDACEAACALDAGCLDALLVHSLAEDLEPDELTLRLVGLAAEFDSAEEARTDLWDDPLNRPRLRLRAAIARTCIDAARFSLARDGARRVVDATLAAGDPLGARHTLMLACARLEDEDGLNRTEALFSGRESAWSHLSRILLLYKLGRMSAARRALRGFDSLCAGGAYALLHPVYVDLYLPERPEVPACGFEEAVMAVREAEPIIADVPEFIGWCQGHEWLAASAQLFAERNDLDW